jgi:mannose-6-phosphate isomerase
VLDRRTLERTQTIGGDNRFHILSILEGALALGDEVRQLTRGQTVLLPACLPPQAIAPLGRCTLLDMYLP